MEVDEQVTTWMISASLCENTAIFTQIFAGVHQGASVRASQDHKSLNHVPISHSQSQALYQEIDY